MGFGSGDWPKTRIKTRMLKVPIEPHAREGSERRTSNKSFERGRVWPRRGLLVALFGLTATVGFAGEFEHQDGMVCNAFSAADRCPTFNAPCPIGSSYGDHCTFCSEGYRHKRCVAGSPDDQCEQQSGHTCGWKFAGRCSGRDRQCRGPQNPDSAHCLGQCQHELCYNVK